MENSSMKDEGCREKSPGEIFYTSDVAVQYETLRQNDRYWAWENDIVDQCLRTFNVNGRVADCPVGTGRFIGIYGGRGLQVLGIDISKDMLDEASKKIAVSGLENQVELIQADVSNLALDFPVVNALVCFRLLHLISEKNLREVVSGLAAISSQYIFLQIFSVNDFNIRRVVGRVIHAISSSEIGFVRKLKYIYRTLRVMAVAKLGPKEVPSANQHKENTFCDVTYVHNLSNILVNFESHGFSMVDSFDFRDNAHLMGESGCYLSMVLVMKKTNSLGS